LAALWAFFAGLNRIKNACRPDPHVDAAADELGAGRLDVDIDELQTLN